MMSGRHPLLALVAATGGFALVSMALFGPSGCGSKSGGSAGPPPDAGIDVQLDPCQECDLEATSPGGMCSSQAEACNASTSCTALATCLSECAIDDSACIGRCATASDAGVVAEYNAVGNCLCATSCAAVCGASCVGAFDAGMDVGGGGGDAGSCNTCESAATTSGGACYSQVSACMNSSSCAALVTCLAGCAAGDTSCVDGCGTSNPAGESDYDAVGTCLCGSACGSPCASECSAGGGDGG
jgi:hypothetical protein